MRGVLVLVLAGVICAPVLVVMAALWAADGSWRFEGHGPKYWFFVKGSRLERLGLVAPSGALPSYTIRLAEGTDPGSSAVAYESLAQPQDVLSTYAARCGEMGLKITRMPGATGQNAGEAGLVCEIEPYLDAKFGATRGAGQEVTEVSVIVWGAD